MTYPCVCVFGRLVLQTNKRYTTLYERNIQNKNNKTKTNRKVENEQKLTRTISTRTHAVRNSDWGKGLHGSSQQNTLYSKGLG